MTAAEIIAETKRRLGRDPGNPSVRQAVVDACARLLASPTLSGDWWAEQIITEAVRILKQQETK